jgi:hypothetical protein
VTVPPFKGDRERHVVQTTEFAEAFQLWFDQYRVYPIIYHLKLFYIDHRMVNLVDCATKRSEWTLARNASVTDKAAFLP